MSQDSKVFFFVWSNERRPGRIGPSLHLAHTRDRIPYGGVRVLVGALVFKTSETEDLGLAGSIPVRLRQPFRGSAEQAAPP